MGTHPIFESDFDCLTEMVGILRANDHVRRFGVSLKTSPDLVLMNRPRALFDAKKHLYDPSNPFANDERLMKMHRLNPAYVQFIQEEQIIEIDFFTKYFHYFMIPSMIFVLWYWNELQKDKRFTSEYSRPLEEWNFVAKWNRLWYGTPMPKEAWEDTRPRDLSAVELHGLKKLGNKPRHISMFENDDQKERYDEYIARKKLEIEVEDKVKAIMVRNE